MIVLFAMPVKTTCSVALRPRTTLGSFASLTLLLLLLALLPRATPYPELVEINSCVFHPNKEDMEDWMYHHDPAFLDVADLSTTLAIWMDSSGTTTSQTICPGHQHTLQVAFNVPGTTDRPQERRALLTASQGAFLDDGWAVTRPDRRCSNRMYLTFETDPMSTQYPQPFTVPCDASGEVEFVVTSAHCEWDECPGTDSALHIAKLTAEIDLSCAAPACRPPGSVDPPPKASPPPPSSPSLNPSPASPSESPSESPKPDASPTLPTPVSPASPPPKPAPKPKPPPLYPVPEVSPPAAPPSQGCQPSSLGYDCSTDIKGQMILHWTSSESPLPPSNICTGLNNSTRPPAGSAVSGTGVRMLHIAASAKVDGYVSIGFPTIPDTMFPADMVLGWIDTWDEPFIGVYDVVEQNMRAKDLRTGTAASWAQSMGIARMKESDGSTSTVLCFSRRLNDPLARHSPNLDPNAMSYEWAVHRRAVLVEHDAGRYGSGTLNLDSGDVSLVSPENKTPYRDAHGAVMLAAWLFFIPIAVVISRHRWTVEGRMLGGTAFWFMIHTVSVAFGMAAFLAGLVIAFVKLGRASRPNTVKESGEFDPWEVHSILGYIVIGLSGVQLLMGIARPDMKAWIRPVWTVVHTNLGLTTVLTAWAAVYTGIAVYHKLYYRTLSLAAWLAPAVAVSVLIVLIDSLLSTVRKYKTRAAPVAGATEEEVVMKEGLQQQLHNYDSDGFPIAHKEGVDSTDTGSSRAALAAAAKAAAAATAAAATAVAAANAATAAVETERQLQESHDTRSNKMHSPMSVGKPKELLLGDSPARSCACITIDMTDTLANERRSSDLASQASRLRSPDKPEIKEDESV